MNRTSVPDKSGQDRERTGRTVRLYRCPVSGGVRKEEIVSDAPCPCGLASALHVCRRCERQAAIDLLVDLGLAITETRRTSGRPPLVIVAAALT